MTDDTHPYREAHNYAVRVEPDAPDREAFTVIAATVNVHEGRDDLNVPIEPSVRLGGIQPHNYPEFRYEDDLFWASGSLGGPRGDARRGKFPSVSLNESDPFTVTTIEETDRPLRSADS